MANKTASSGIVRRWQAGAIRSSFAGTDSPSKTLDITGEGRFSSDLTLGNGSTPDLIFEQGDSSIIGPNNANFVIRSRGNDAAEGIFLKGADGAGIQILKDGKVGINDTTPTYALDVNGTGRFVGHVDLQSSCDVSGLLRINDKVGIQDGGWYTPTTTLGVNGTFKATGAATFDGTVAITGALSPLGDTNYNDNKKAKFGNGNDLNIYHDGTHSYIKQTGTGNLRLSTAEFRVTNAAVNETMISASQDDGVDLYFNDSLKLSTVTGGVDVSGALTIDGNITNSNDTGYFYLNNAGTGNSGLYIAGFSTDIMRCHVPAGKYFQWEVGGAEKLKLDSAGLLTVAGSIKNAGGTGHHVSIVNADVRQTLSTTSQGDWAWNLNTDNTFYVYDYNANVKRFNINGSDGSVDVLGALTVGGNAVVTGNLTVNGTTTTIDTTNLLIEDPLMLLARVQSGTPTLDSGFIIERGSSTNVGIIWDESADEFALINTTDTATTAGNVTIASYANLQANAGNFSGAIETTSVFTVGSNSSSYAINIKRNNSSPYIQWSNGGDRLGYIQCTTANMYIANDNASGIIFNTNDSSEKMRIQNDGKVGIGNTSPDFKLEVGNAGGTMHSSFSIVGETSIAAGVSNKAIYLWGDGTTFGLNAHDYAANGALPLKIGWSGGDVILNYTGGGKVGIGTASPSSRLHINGGVGSFATGLTFGDGDTGFYEDSDDSLWYFSGGVKRWKSDSGYLFSTITTSKATIVNEVATATNPAYTFYNDLDTGLGHAAANQLSLIAGGVKAAVVTSTGFGIRTTPASGVILDVRDSGDANTKQYLINTGQTTAGRETEYIFGKDNGANLSATLKYYYHTTQASRRIDLLHYITNAGLTILNTGSIGFNDTAPDRMLTLKGGTVNGSTRYPGIHGHHGSNTLFVMEQWYGNEGYLALYKDNVRTVQFRGGEQTAPSYIDNGNNFGLGTKTPGAKLEIQGDTSARAFLTVGSSTTAAVGYFYTNAIHTGVDTSSIVSIRSDHASSTGKVLHVRGDGSGNLLTLDQGGTDRLVVQADGNVGIGTTAPKSLLSIDSNTAFNLVAGTSTGQDNILLHNNANGDGDGNYGPSIGFGGALDDSALNRRYAAIASVQTSSDNDRVGLAFITHPGSGSTDALVEQMRIKHDGRVGMGTASPGALLHIEGGASEISTQPLKVSAVWGQTTIPMVLFENRHDGNGLKITNNAARSDAELFEITNSAGTVVMVKGHGNVGIGTNAPASKLHVTGAPGNSTYLAYMYNSASHTQAHGLNVQIAGSGSAAYALRVNTSADTNSLAVMGNGEVGIGTSVPAAKLDVASTGSEGTPTLQLGYATNADRSNHRFAFYTDSEAGYISNKNGNNGIRFRHRSNTVMQVGYGGTSATPYVGIGTTAPSSKLHVANGNFLISAPSYGGGTGGLANIDLRTTTSLSGTYGGGTVFSKKYLLQVLMPADATQNDTNSRLIRLQIPGGYAHAACGGSGTIKITYMQSHFGGVASFEFKFAQLKGAGTNTYATKNWGGWKIQKTNQILETSSYFTQTQINYVENNLTFERYRPSTSGGSSGDISALLIKLPNSGTLRVRDIVIEVNFTGANNWESNIALEDIGWYAANVPSNYANDDRSVLTPVELWSGVHSTAGTIKTTSNIIVNGTSLFKGNATVEGNYDLMVGNTAINLASGFSNQKGFSVDGSSGRTDAVGNNTTGLQVGRYGGTGTVQAWRYAGNQVATMGSSGDLTVGTLTESSSIAMKENIFDFNTTLDKINRVRPVRFNKKKSKDKKEIGFIAEELAEIFPELVENDENGNPTSVNYTRAVTVLFDGFKQMYKELKEIKEKIK